MKPTLYALAASTAAALVTATSLMAAGCAGSTDQPRHQSRSVTLRVDFVAISPDGRRVVFAAGRGPQSNRVDAIYVARSGCSPKRITDSDLDENWPVWSPDGSQIVFTREGAESDVLVHKLWVARRKDDCVYAQRGLQRRSARR
jgi:hypothetical protein